ncbi:hypothetical protein CYMTET_20391 [Cymbomonas tetramitiformis]|uniref:Carboxylesterase type B domain-containing protein n=1 Tax=Cymbomonas tetramitiformis TaxID=36881 RepID=A0AAE0L499_9CHLO|nr:hypothetical protein CYMTET_20391 [Cymbomonas tetramitiformis]
MAQNPKVLQQVSELEYEESETGSLASEEDSIPLLNLDPNCSKSTNQLLATETPPAAHPWVPSRAGPEANSRIRTIRWLAPSSVLCALLVFGIAVLTLLRGEASEQKQKQMTTAKDPSTDPIVLTDTLVNIPDGTLDGAETDNSFEFLGVPYAESPTGDLRWRPPLQVAPWGGVRSAKRLGSSCWQYYRSISIPQDEDCLFLNVFVPKANARAAASRHGADAHEPLPVMVWIHGGGFVYGSSSNKEYNGTNILKLNKGVIVVTINYRLGVFGYGGNAALQARDASNTTGNYGQQDQREALRWVQRNIAAFGGDPLRVTLFGQSSGAASISLHLVTPGSWGLFDRAILESGSYPAWTALSAEATWHNLDLVARKSRCDVPAELGFNSTLDCLLSLSGEDLNRHQRVPVPCRDGCNWGATVDGVELPDYPWWLAWGGKIAPGKQVLHGTTRDDGSQFVDIPYKATEEDLVGYWKQQFGDAPGYTSDEVVARLHELYPAAKHKHAGGGMYSPHFMAAAESETDFAYRCAAQWTSQAMAQAKVSVYEYLWSFCEGSCVYFVEHSSEIPYVFNYNAKRMNPFEIQMSRDIIELWTAFATAGNPNDGRLNHWRVGINPKVLGFRSTALTPSMTFWLLRSAMSTVLDSVNAVETTKLFDVELAYASYHFDLNSIIFTMLSVLLRGAALGIYHSTACTHPLHGRAAMLRLYFEVEGVQNVIGNLYLGSDSTFDTVVLHIRRTWQREAANRLARFPSQRALVVALRSHLNLAVTAAHRRRLVVLPAAVFSPPAAEDDVGNSVELDQPASMMTLQVQGEDLQVQGEDAQDVRDELPVTPAFADAFLDGGSYKGFPAFEELLADVQGLLWRHWTPYGTDRSTVAPIEEVSAAEA